VRYACFRTEVIGFSHSEEYAFTQNQKRSEAAKRGWVTRRYNQTIARRLREYVG
jgi:hypothetical protein